MPGCATEARTPEWVAAQKRLSSRKNVYCQRWIAKERKRKNANKEGLTSDSSLHCLTVGWIFFKRKFNDRGEKSNMYKDCFSWQDHIKVTGQSTRSRRSITKATSLDPSYFPSSALRVPSGFRPGNFLPSRRDFAARARRV